MKLSEAMREKMLLSFELFPPKTEKGMANLPGTIEHLMKYRPEYISCTYGAGGGNVGANREVCQMIRNAGTIPVTHFTVIKNTKEGIKNLYNVETNAYLKVQLFREINEILTQNEIKITQMDGAWYKF